MAEGERIVFKSTGKPAEVLEWESFSPPDPGDGEVRLRMLAAPINPADLNTIEGTYGVKPPLPATPGIEGCGMVEASKSPSFQEGDRVMILRRAGSWASHVVMPATDLFTLPEGIDIQQAAMLKVNPATAWRLLHDFGGSGPGTTVIQNAGNSAVGRCVIQLGKLLGVRVISFVRRAELIEELRALGAEHVFTDDEAGRQMAKDVLGGANAGLAFNAVGGESALGLLKLLGEGGTHVTYGAMGRKPVTVANGLLIFRDVIVRGLWVTRWLERAPDAEIKETYQALAERVNAGEIVQKVDSTFRLRDFDQALARLDGPRRDGKVLFAFE